MNQQFLTVEEAAQRLRLAPFTVRAYLRDGRLRGVKLPGRSRAGEWRIPEDAVSDLARGQNANPPQPALDEAVAPADALGEVETRRQRMAEALHLADELRAQLEHIPPLKAARLIDQIRDEQTEAKFGR